MKYTHSLTVFLRRIKKSAQQAVRVLEPRKRTSACIVLSHYCRSLNAFDVGGKCVTERESRSVLKRFGAELHVLLVRSPLLH